MTFGITFLAVVTLGVLLWRGGGGRVAVIFAAMAGALIGFVGTIAAAVYGGLAQVGAAVLGVFQ